MKRRGFLFGLAGRAAPAALAAKSGGPGEWMEAVRSLTGDTPALERLGGWLQVAALEQSGARARSVLGALRGAQEADGYLGVYGKADRLGASDRAGDELWGTAELGRGLLMLTRQGDRPADALARRLGSLLITVSPDRLDRDAGQQHPGASALLYFLTGMARHTGDAAYERCLRVLPPRIGLPGEKAPFPPALPPVLNGWGRDPRRDARGLAALAGILALARFQGHTLLEDAVRERWGELARTFPARPTEELAARWLRLTADLGELAAAVPGREGDRVPSGSPYPEMIRAYGRLVG